MNFGININVGAEFKLIVKKASDDSIVHETPFFKNLVLNSGLDRMSVGAWIDRCAVGSSNIEPAITQTSLQGFVASSTSNQLTLTGIVTASPCYYWLRRTWRFLSGVATGNLSEVGLGWSDTSMWNRSLIKDINGNPTTITIRPDEYLDVISEVRVYPAESLSGVFDLFDKNNTKVSTHTFIGKPYFVDANMSFSFSQLSIALSNCRFYTGDIGANTITFPSGTMQQTTKTRVASYPTARSCLTKVTLGLNDANISHKSFYFNVGGVIYHGSDSGYQFQIDPPITVKNNTREMEYNISLTWDRIA